MTQIHWTTATSANFHTAADWTGGQVPGPSDDAILDAMASHGVSGSGSEGAANHAWREATPMFLAARMQMA